MKEDGARRRAFELLIEALMGGSEQLACQAQDRTRTARRSAEAIRPSVLQVFEPPRRGLAPRPHPPTRIAVAVGRHSPALCGDCNSAKRDRPPSEFYTPKEIKQLAAMVGLSEEVLRSPSPNLGILQQLLGRLPWFFDEFLTTDDMTKERDGKTAGELLVKALDKVLAAAGSDVRLIDELERRRRSH